MNKKQFLSLIISLFLCFMMLSGAIICHAYVVRDAMLVAVSDLSTLIEHHLDTSISPAVTELNRIHYAIENSKE
ncbi:MAG: hypothetical protein ACI3XZ_01555 [Butyricicoccus sp.]